MCTVARAKTVIGILVLMSMTINLPMIKYAASTQNDCNIDMEYEEYAARFNLADTVVSFSIPLGSIIVLNVGITYGVARSGRARRAAAQATPGRCQLARALPPQRTQQRVTKMLLIVSSVFVVLNVPNYTMRILAYRYDWVSILSIITIFWRFFPLAACYRNYDFLTSLLFFSNFYVCGIQDS